MGWYLRQGFSLAAAQLSLSANGLGPRDELPTGVEIEVAPFGPDPLWTWLPEAWTRTPRPERAYLEIDRARIWLTREGRAWLGLRLELDASAAEPGQLEDIVMQLRRAIATDTSLLLYPCTAGSTTAEALASAGFMPVQRSFLVRRPTGK
jgi:hypothetical protein